MTGYGYCESDTIDGIGISVEIRSVNRKQLDIKISLPGELLGQELSARKLISSRISRGSVYVKVEIKLNETILNKTIKINDALINIYLEKTEKIKNSLGISGELEIKDVLGFPGVIEEVEPDVVSGDLTIMLHQTIEKALANLNNSREEEGLFLKRDILKRIKILKTLIDEIEPLADKLPEYYKAKLQKRLAEENVLIMPKLDSSSELQTKPLQILQQPLQPQNEKTSRLGHIDDDRLLREIVIYSDKCDVSEEITRLKGHFIQFKNILETKDGPVGRNLDFLTQEIQREINTLGVKAASTDVSPKIVLFKTEAEKIREQIQNIE